MCNKCEQFHSKLCQNHKNFVIDKEKESEDMFTGFCKEEDHQMKLDFFCATHNELCCAACLCKIKKNGNGKHKDCEVYCIEEIKDKKQCKLKENIKYLEEISNTFQQSINNLKIIYEKINANKEELKLKIQKIFTKLRNELNNREDELISDVDIKFENIYFKEEIIKESEKMPNKIKLSLEKGKLIDINNNNDNKIRLLINECINIENNIKDINIINEKMKKSNEQINIKFKFNPEEEEETFNKFIQNIKSFGKISYNVSYNDAFKYSIKKCPLNINENRKYIVSGEKQNILTKTGTNGQWMGTICEKELEKNKEHTWKIRILKTQNKNISIGVAPIDFDINSSNDTNCGWYLYCLDSTLYSGPPYNYNCKNLNLKNVDKEVKIVMNMNMRTLKFIIDNEDKGVSYNDIPIDKPLFPAFFLLNTNDSIEVLEC